MLSNKKIVKEKGKNKHCYKKSFSSLALQIAYSTSLTWCRRAGLWLQARCPLVGDLWWVMVMMELGVPCPCERFCLWVAVEEQDGAGWGSREQLRVRLPVEEEEEAEDKEQPWKRQQQQEWDGTQAAKSRLLSEMRKWLRQPPRCPMTHEGIFCPLLQPHPQKGREEEMREGGRKEERESAKGWRE